MSEEKIRNMLSETVISGRLTKEELRGIIYSLGVKVTGVIGPYVLRYKNEKLIISLRPVNFRMSNTEKAIAERKKHASATKFAKFLYNIEPLKKVWEQAAPAGSNKFNRIIKYNKRTLVNDCPSINNIITPAGFQFGISPAVSVKNGTFNISIDYLQNDDLLIMVLIPFDPVNKSDNSFECIKVYCSSASPCMKIRLNEEQNSICMKYKRFIVYTAVIRKQGNSYQWSNTVSQEGKFDLGFRVDYAKAESCGYGQINIRVYKQVKKSLRYSSRQLCRSG